MVSEDLDRGSNGRSASASMTEGDGRGDRANGRRLASVKESGPKVRVCLRTHQNLPQLDSRCCWVAMISMTPSAL